ncbi:MAG: 2-oxo acid dehydrogenase subunit E2, partial [Clostridiales bacterium]|nr:2-oxo acid dehydrogenase subunit E2 [Clostridiales bacterium]
MKAQKRGRGDRRDARRVRDLDPMHQFMPYIMPIRTECEVYIHEKIDITDALAYLNEVNQLNTSYKVTLFHLFLAAISKTIVLRPYLNRFISGRRFYERDEVSLSFVGKKVFSD